MIEIHSLRVKNGDCFMILFTDCEKPILLVIDSGFVNTYHMFKYKLKSLIDTYDCEVHMVLTHIDADHIGGFKCLFSNAEPKILSEIAGFYYNTLESLQIFASCVTPEMVKAADEIAISTKTSYGNAVTLEKYLKEKNICVHTGLRTGHIINICKKIRAYVLSPSPNSLQKFQNWCEKESDRKTASKDSDYDIPLAELMVKEFESDSSPVNASSISLLIEAPGQRLLFLGDAQSDDVEKGLKSLGYSEENPVHVDMVKVSHHGSRFNTSPKLLELIHAERFLFSGTGTRGHPDKETLARIIHLQNQPILCFNYDIADDIFSSLEKEKFSIKIECATEWRLE